LALLTLSRLRSRLAREPQGADDAAAIGRALELASRILSSVAAALNAGVKGTTQLECLVGLRDAASKLREPHDNPDVAALRADPRSQRDALAGQLRMATELAAHASPEGSEEFHRGELLQPWRLRLAGIVPVLRANLSLRSGVCRHAIRLAACVALADFLGRA